MTQSPSQGKRTGWPLGLIGMLALVAATERYIEGRNIDFGTLLTIEWRRTGKSVYKEAPRADVLCFGTSLSRVGVSPNILKERTGLESFNLGLSGGQPFATYTMLKHALDAGARPKAIVVDFKWSSIWMDPIGAERIFPEIATFPECLTLAREMGDSSFLGRLSLVSLLPSYRCRPEIRQNIVAALAGAEPERNVTWLTMARNTKVNHGAHHTPRVDFPAEVPPGAEQVFMNDWKVHPIAEVYINKFLALAESRQIPVIWLIPPVSPGAQAKLKQLGADDLYMRYAQQKIAKYPGVSIVDGRGSGYPKDAFYDLTHLNRFGAANLSEDVGDAIVARLGSSGTASPRWVSLPGFRGNASGEKLEDFLGSHAAVAAAFKDKVRR
jgi:hypothetical protein